jgi:hypothetical protein
LQCFNNTQEDADGDLLFTNFTWYNNTIKTEFTDPYIGIHNTSKTQNWICELNITDNINMNVANTTFLTILNSPPFFNDSIPSTLTVQAGVTYYWQIANITDVDGDTLTYYVNDSRISIQNNGTLNDTSTSGDLETWVLNISVDDGEVNVSTILSYGIGDVLPPAFKNNATNTSTIRINDWVRFNTSCNDNIGNSGFIFSHNNSRVWANESYVTASGTNIEANFTLQVTLRQNDTFGWRFICNDTSSNVGHMGIITFNINNTAPDKPTIHYPENNASYQSLNINFSASDADSDTLNYTVFINNTFNISSQQNISNLDIGEGVYNLTLSAYDGIDYSENSSIVFRIDTLAPEITLITPINRSGDNDGNVTFEYTVNDLSSINNCSLIFNNLINITNSTVTRNINQNFTLYNLSAESFTWSVNCTDSAGNYNITETRIFAVIKTTEYNGDTTDFSTVNVYNIPNLIIEDTKYGKISLIDPVNFGAGADFDRYMNISNNLIKINSSGLPLLNVSSDVWLYTLPLANPEPLRNNTLCFPPLCTEKGGDRGNFTFNVSQLAPYGAIEFTTYSARETPGPEPEPTPGVPAGTGAGPAAPSVITGIKYDFRLDKEEIIAKLKIGKDTQESIEVINLGTIDFTVDIEIEGLTDFISVSDYSFDLDIGERKTLILNIVGKKFGIFTGRLIATVENITKTVPITIEIESEKALFDVKLDIPTRYKRIAPGDNLRSQVTLFNVLGGKVDVDINYLVKDLRSNVISEETETFPVETQSSYVKEFNLPKDIKPETYIAAIEVRYVNAYAVSSQIFEVMTEEEAMALKEARIKVFSIFFIVVVSALVYVYLLMRFVRKKREGY